MRESNLTQTYQNLEKFRVLHLNPCLIIICDYSGHDKITAEEKIEIKLPRMSKLTSLFLIIIFFISLFIGITIGAAVDTAQVTPPPTHWNPPIASDTIGSVLVLGLNDLEIENPYLESAWIATISSTNHNDANKIEVVLVGLYPLSSGQVTNPNQGEYIVPHPPIEFPKAYLANMQDFNLLNTVPILNRTDIFFEDVVVVDEFGMNYIIELTNTNPQVPPPPPTEETFCRPWENPQHAHDIQHNILKTLCAPPQNILQYTNFIHVFDLIPNHLVSTLSQDDIIALWQVNINLNNPPSISCKIFP